jgi:hypothetical protein
MSNDANARMNNYIERAAIGLLTVVLAFVTMLYNSQQDAIKELRNQNIVLQTTKVDRSDLKEFKEEINASISAMKTDLITRSANDKKDILDRIDLLIKQK